MTLSRSLLYPKVSSNIVSQGTSTLQNSPWTLRMALSLASTCLLIEAQDASSVTLGLETREALTSH